jgi:hypothetical protein
MATNIKTVKITVPNEIILKKVNSTPVFQRLVRNKLKVGENIENVNHYQYSEILRMFTIAGCKVEDISDDEFSGGGDIYNRGNRPSPRESATLYSEGFEMEGQDGNMYRIVVDKNGRHSWKLCRDCDDENKSKYPNIDRLNAMETDSYKYWFERFDAHGGSEIEEIYKKTIKKLSENPTLYEKDKNRIQAILDVAKKRGINTELNIEKKENMKTEPIKIKKVKTNFITKLVNGTDEELAAHYKAKGMDSRRAFTQYIIDKNLQPDIDAKPFYKIFNEVSPKLITDEYEDYDAIFTHFDTLKNMKVENTNMGEFTKHVWEDGSTGSTPNKYLDERYTPLTQNSQSLTENTSTNAVKYRAEVTGINEDVWSGNAIEYDTVEEAEQYLNNLSSKWFGFDMSRIVPTTTPTRQKVDYDNDMFYQDFRHKESKKNYDRSKIEQAQAVTQQLPERKFHKGDIVKDKNGTNYRVTGELQYNQTFKDYDVLVVDADVPLDKIFKEYIFSEKNLTKVEKTWENQGGEKFEVQKSEYNIFKGTDYNYENFYQLNKAIEELINKKVKYSITANGVVNIVSNTLTSDETVFLNTYVGYGGLEKFGAKMGDGSPTALKYEYYTPDDIIKMMWALAYKYGGQPKSILEPSCATGRFFKYAPENSIGTGYEINIYSAVICKILYPNIVVVYRYFEQLFLKNNLSIRKKIYDLTKHDLVIGNPPYGDISDGASKWFGMGEDKYSHATNYIDYFIFRGIDLLIDGGLLIYIVGAEKHAGGSLFLEKGMNTTKEMIAEKADLIDAYKLPAKLFQTTGVSSEIIVLKKK